MKILIVAATKAEIQPFIETQPACDILITGVGMVATAYKLAKQLSTNSYDLVINAGIAGSFDRTIVLGSAVQVISDGFPELGAEDGDSFIDLFSMGFVDKDEVPFKNKRLENSFFIEDMQKVTGVTVNKVHGNEVNIAKLQQQFPAQVESMEGAAFLYVCLLEGVKCVQLRTISNYVERRNREAWNIPLAVKNLNTELKRLTDRYLQIK